MNLPAKKLLSKLFLSLISLLMLGAILTNSSIIVRAQNDAFSAKVILPGDMVFGTDDEGFDFATNQMVMALSNVIETVFNQKVTIDIPLKADTSSNGST